MYPRKQASHGVDHLYILIIMEIDFKEQSTSLFTPQYSDFPYVQFGDFFYILFNKAQLSIVGKEKDSLRVAYLVS